MVREGLNETRNYAQSQLRDLIVNRIVQGLQVPTPEQVEMCATRDPSLHTDPSNHWIFMFYWDDLLFKVVGKDYWNPHQRWHNIIQEAVLPKERGLSKGHQKPCISDGTEAFLVTLYKNCYEKWVWMGEEKKAGNDHNRKDPKAKTPFISTKSGQARWGGWNEEGRDYFVKVRNEITEQQHKNKKQVVEMEKACLFRLRKLHKLIGEDGKLIEKQPKKRKAAVLEEEVIDDDDEL